MKTYKLFNLVFASFFLVCASANATLIDRGNNLIYDDDLNITWLRDTSFGNQKHKGTWNEANAWADSLDKSGFSDWRLPKMPQTDPSCVPLPTIDLLKFKNCTDGEMGHLYYTELGNDWAETFRDIRTNNFGPLAFIKDYPDGYWTSTKFDPTLDWSASTDLGASFPSNENYHWLFYLGKGTKFVFGDGNSRHAIAVRDGDVVAADSSGTLNDDLSFHCPSLNYQSPEGTLNIWANLSPYGTGPNNEALWGLADFAPNKTALTGSMTGEVTEDLTIKIRSLNYQNASYWATFEYYGIDNETHLWTLVDSGINP